MNFWELATRHDLSYMDLRAITGLDFGTLARWQKHGHEPSDKAIALERLMQKVGVG